MTNVKQITPSYRYGAIIAMLFMAGPLLIWYAVMAAIALRLFCWIAGGFCG